MTGVSTPVGRRALIALCTLLMALGLAGIGSPVVLAKPAPDIPGCEAQKQAFDANESAIDQHNAQPHEFYIPEQQAAANAYDAEKAQLDARQAQLGAAGMACEAAVKKLSAGGVPIKPTASELAAIDAEKGRLSRGYVAPAPPRKGSNGNVELPPELRALVKALRGPPGALSQKVGNATLQGKSRSDFVVGEPDPFRLGHTVQPSPNDASEPRLEVDHVDPLANVVQKPGFLRLPAELMYMVAHSPLNLQYLTRNANLAKGSRDIADMMNVGPGWQKEQLALQRRVEQQLQEIIDQLVATLPPGQ